MGARHNRKRIRHRPIKPKQPLCLEQNLCPNPWISPSPLLPLGQEGMRANSPLTSLPKADSYTQHNDNNHGGCSPPGRDSSRLPSLPSQPWQRYGLQTLGQYSHGSMPESGYCLPDLYLSETKLFGPESEGESEGEDESKPPASMEHECGQSAANLDLRVPMLDVVWSLFHGFDYED